MLRNPIPSHTRDPEDDKPERGGGRTASARRLRHDADDVDDDEDDYGDDLEDADEDGDGDDEGEEKYAQSRMVVDASDASDASDSVPRAAGSGHRAATRDSRDDDDEDDEAYDDDEQALTEADVMTVLDRDDLKNMEGPDA